VSERERKIKQGIVGAEKNERSSSNDSCNGINQVAPDGKQYCILGKFIYLF
jgi:hypothetical protein